MGSMKTLRPILIAILLLTLDLGGIPPSPVHALNYLIYDDALGSGWDNWSWNATINLAATSPVHNGSHSIAVTLGGWGALSLHKGGADTAGATHLRFFLHGGSSGGQQMNVFLNLDVNGAAVDGPAVSVPSPAANTWSEVKIPLASLNPTNAIVTRINWQDATGGNQSTLYFDDISFSSDTDPNAPSLTQGSLFPRSLPADGSTVALVKVNAGDPQGLADIAAISLDASQLGGGTIQLKDDGLSNDGAAGDGVYGAAFSVPANVSPREVRPLLTVQDNEGHTSAFPLGAFNVLGSPGGAIPASLPQRFGWGTNEWNENNAQDWQVNSGVSWDYNYQYITYGWETWGDNFVQRYVQHAWDHDYIPMVTVYMVLGTPPTCGETSTCYAQKLKDASFVQAYIASLERAAQQARGDSPVIFNLEPDFYGYMQQLSNSSGRPAGVQPDDPSSYPVALNKTGYANNLAGFGRYIVDLIHATAPNALAAPMASMWATNGDPQTVTAEEAIQMGQRTAAFIDAMGGAQADVLIAEWSDRDAGFGLRPWWDDTDQNTPRPTRAILWENALSRAAGKRVFLWQIPVGNMNLDNTCDHYQDNRVAYAFNHPRDLADAGVIGMLFGGGASCMTSASTDGGFVKNNGVVSYAPPAQPTGLSHGLPNGVLVQLHWNESSDQDLWGYRVYYRLLPGGAQSWMDASRRTQATLLLPQAGDWEIRLATMDALGNISTQSAAVTVSTTATARQVYLSVVTR